MGVFCIEDTANDESISYIFEKVNIPLSFDVMLRRTIQTNHSNVVIFCGTDLWCTPVRWAQIPWYAFQVP
jgi:hypothetical protein